MKTTTLLAGIALVLIPMTAFASPMKMAHKANAKKTATTMYQCQKCHMKVSAAVAKKDHYKDPMDGGKLVPMTSGKPMAGMKM